MTSAGRGVLLPAVYTCAVLTPAVLALAFDPFTADRQRLVELSGALGLFAVPVVLLQFALISRIRSVSRWLGTDALIQFHQYAGLLSLLLIVLHVVLLNVAWLPLRTWSPFSGPRATQFGAVAFWALVALIVTTVWRRGLRVSYESWRSLHLGLALVATAALAAHLLAVHGYARAGAMRLFLALLFGGAVIATIEYRLVRPWRLGYRPWQIVGNTDEGASIRTLRLRPERHTRFRFAPGQFAWLITGRSAFSSQQHPLSISSSAEAGGHLEFSIKALGDWSGTTVPALTPGTRVWVDGPYGSFTPAAGSLQPLVLIAGGIGIAPMRCILHTLADRREERHVILIYAAHDESRVAFREELDALRSRLHLKVVFVYEQPAGEWSGERGFITTDLLGRTLGHEAATAECFVCGPIPMMDAVDASLRAVGVHAAAIHTERFQVI